MWGLQLQGRGASVSTGVPSERHQRGLAGPWALLLSIVPFCSRVPLPFLMREGRVVPHEQAPLSPTQPGLSALKDRGCISVPCSLSMCQRLHTVGVVVFIY